jgi:hypothetical protein
MNESSALSRAREQLSLAEKTYRSEDGLFHLEEGLALLEEAIADGRPDDRKIARNLAATYSTKICNCVGELLEKDRALPEPELERLFKLILAFDQGDFRLPDSARTIKIAIARRLLDRYYEGHPPHEKAKALEQLAEISKRK